MKYIIEVWRKHHLIAKIEAKDTDSIKDFVDFWKYMEDQEYCVLKYYIDGKRLSITEEMKFERETLGETEKINNLKKIIDYYGEEKQIIKAIEEMSELQKELCKKLLGKSNIYSLTEEIADVQIMLDQLKLIVGDTELKTIMQSKIDRTMKVIEEKQNGKEH